MDAFTKIHAGFYFNLYYLIYDNQNNNQTESQPTLREEFPSSFHLTLTCIF